ncbi:MAG: hypothetical protein HY905_06410 [Deltaproteobacteria bacterium]|nr:hypothetical protein [Deltaproteobacteria bacterium]
MQHPARFSSAVRRAARVLLPVALGALLACTHPPSPTTARPPALSRVEGLDRSTAPADCDTPLPANEPEGCHDDSVRPTDAPPADRPGADRDGDGVEDLLDVCPDQPAAPGTDADGDGCADGSAATSS